MARRASFSSSINAIIREHEKVQRARERERIRIEKEQVRVQKQVTRQRSLDEKAAHLQSRLDEVDDRNDEVRKQMLDLATLLEQTLTVNDTIRFDDLRDKREFKPRDLPVRLQQAKERPNLDLFIRNVKPITQLERVLRNTGRYDRDVTLFTQKYNVALREYELEEAKRNQAIAEFKASLEAELAENEKRLERNREIDRFEAAYRSGDPQAVITYCEYVLERSNYPEGFPQEFRLAYLPESKELVVEYELPTTGVIPDEEEYRYVKSKDLIESKARKIANIKATYQDIVAAITLRTIHEIIEADQGNYIDVVVFSGHVQSVDLATGNDTHPCLVSVRTTKSRFSELNLRRIDKRTCLRNLGASVSPQPYEMQPVKPVLEFSMVDKRFVEQSDVLNELESRPNLMDLSPFDFEALVGNLFTQMGLETRLTRSSRDGGVDVVAYDTRPILGGKVVIQAKRYRNTVGVWAVRDLFGTMLNEGANKGILVTTSSYGPDAYEFSNDKPIELIDGGGLLYLLKNIGVEARIVIPPE